MTVKHPLNLKLKHIRWRNAAYHFVAENGPSTIERIFESLSTGEQYKVLTFEVEG